MPLTGSYDFLKATNLFNKWETLVPPQDGSSLASKSKPGEHGTSGPVQVLLLDLMPPNVVK